MAWHVGSQKIEKIEDYNSIVKELSGDLDDTIARITLTKFLKANLGFTFEMLCGIKLMPVQEILLKALFARDNALIVAGRGFSKSFLISVFSILYSIFYPDKKVCLISANFRSARRILDNSEKMVNSKKAALLRQCFPNQLRRANDMFSWKLPNQSEIFALPLSNGEGLRGTRANCVCVDEGLLISREIQETILRPFLTVQQDFREEAEMRDAENTLIEAGKITENDRISFPKNKYCVFSSASYEFQYLFEMYNQWLDFIDHPDKIEGAPGQKPPKYVVVRASYESLPANGIMDLTQINSAKAGGGENSEYFKREYRALFSKTGEGFFNVQKLHKCTVPLFDYPTVQLLGEKDCQYILSIDPSYSASKASDHFAMGVYMLIPQKRKIILVNSYAQAGRDLKDHYEYLTYILKYFNIVFVCIDNSGSEFIHGYNESQIAKDAGYNLKFLEVDFSAETYLEEIAKAKNQYNQMAGKIVYGQQPTSQGNRQMNEHLQNQIDCEKIWFASSLGANEKEVKKLEKFTLPFKPKNKNDQDIQLSEFISDQDSWIEATKNQVALIEAKSTILGNLQYDLPQNLKRETGPNRARKDSYMCLLLAAWGARHYYEMVYTEAQDAAATFIPIIIR